MKPAKVFSVFFAIIFSLASLGFYLYTFFAPSWDLSLRLIPLYLYPARMFLILSIMMIIFTVVLSKKNFDDKTITKICIIACVVMICMGIGTAVCAHKDYNDFTFKFLGKVDFESEREKYVPYNDLFEKDLRESNYVIHHKGNKFGTHVYVENYFTVSSDRDLSYSAEFFKTTSPLMKFRFNNEKLLPWYDEPITRVLSTVGESNQKNGIDYSLFVNENDYAIKIFEEDNMFYIYLLNAKKYNITTDDFTDIAVAQYGLLKDVADGKVSLLGMDN